MIWSVDAASLTHGSASHLTNPINTPAEGWVSAVEFVSLLLFYRVGGDGKANAEEQNVDAKEKVLEDIGEVVLDKEGKEEMDGDVEEGRRRLSSVKELEGEVDDARVERHTEVRELPVAVLRGELNV